MFALKDISLSVEKGEVLTLMGPSGSGKTSLLRNICGLDFPDSGEVLVNGRNITTIAASRRNIGMIFQDLAIFPHMKVYDNIAYGLRNLRLGEKEVRDRVNDLADMLGISELLNRFPGEISGGQRQRVALGRSVAPSPDLLLLDEPLSSLDIQVRMSLRSEIREFASKAGLTMIYVTHDHAEGLYMADRAAIIFRGILGEIKKPSDLFLHPSNDEIAKFFGYNVITLGGERIAFFPSEFTIDSVSPDVSGTIESIGFEGEYYRIHMSSENFEKIQLKVSMEEMTDSIRKGNRIGIKLTRPEVIEIR
ncbi:MAG: ABC transporter ATP-binding protein [Thermoplasmataceae archaeon]